MDPLAGLFERYRRDGDLQALGQVFDALAPRLLAVALHLCGNEADAEDVLQQTFLLAMERELAFDATRRLEPFLAGLLHNVARNARRSSARRRVEPLPELAHGDAGPIAAAEREELLALLTANVDALPAEQRQVLRLQLQHGLSPAEIAAALEVPPGTVRMRIHRGIEALRRLLPAGLAGWLLAAFPSRGLAAVRRQVMEAGRAQVVASAAVASVGVVGGVLLMKKVAVALIVAAVIALATWTWWSGERAVTLPETASAAGPSAVIAAAAHDVSAPAPIDSDGERSAVTPSVGALRVRVTVRANSGGDDDAVPLAGTPLAVWAGESPLVPFQGEVHRATTGADGEAVFAELAPGPWHALLVSEREGTSQRVVVAPGGETLLPIERTVERVVRGIVLNADGAPVLGAEVWVHRERGTGRYSMPEPAEVGSRRAAVTGSDGRFAVPIMARETRIAACCAGHGESFAAYTSTDEEVRLVLGRAFATVSGSVCDARGQSISGALVSFTPAGQDERRAGDGTLLAPRVGRLGRTGADGRFQFDGVAPGRVRVWATASDFAAAWQDLDLEPFGVRDLALLLADSQSVNVIGTVRYSDATAARVMVYARPSLDPNGHYSHPETREDGSYELTRLPAHTRLVLDIVGWGGKRLAVREFASLEPGVLRCDIVLEGGPPALDARATAVAKLASQASSAEKAAPAPLATLRVQIMRVDGSPWRGSMPFVGLLDGNGARVQSPNEPVPDGTRLRVAPGAYTAQILGDDLIAAPQRVELTLDAEVEVRFAVDIGRTRTLVCNGDGAQKPRVGDALHVTVRTPGGAIVVQSDVTRQMADLRGFRYWHLDHVFAFGRYEVDAHSDSGLRYRGSLDVRDDLEDPTRVDVPLVVR